MPNIIPPTDNLYKFIALFGLAIILFSFYKSNEVFEGIKESKSKVEELRDQIHIAIWDESKNNVELDDSSDLEIASFSFKHVSGDMEALTKFIDASSFSDSIKFKMDAQIRRMHVELDVLEYRTREYYFMLGAGLLLMISGFSLWYLKDQKHRDRRIKLAKEIDKRTDKKEELAEEE